MPPKNYGGITYIDKYYLRLCLQNVFIIKTQMKSFVFLLCCFYLIQY